MNHFRVRCGDTHQVHMPLSWNEQLLAVAAVGGGLKIVLVLIPVSAFCSDTWHITVYLGQPGALPIF